ncbi:MAG: META domain-containing protein, partial [Proteobacteria bacterium]|nr:META domain-containing protein [Pseudomonadota bacterium]
YLARIAAPPNAVFAARIERVTPGAAPEIVGRFLQAPAGNPPYRFEIAYETAGGGQLRLVTRVIADDRVLFSAEKDLDAAAMAGAPVELVMSAGTGQAPTAVGTATPTHMVGLYSYIADTGSFLRCDTQQRLPVATEGDNAALESAYSNTRRNPGEGLLAEVVGRIVERLPMEGRTRPTLVVDRFVTIRAEDSCPKQAGDAAPGLTNTYWKLTQLGGSAIVPEKGKREAHLIFKDQRVSGSGGCNSMAGGYTLDGETLKFSQMAGTMMACAAGMDEESRLGLALTLVARWKISGRQLDLLDSEGQLLARLEANALYN